MTVQLFLGFVVHKCQRLDCLTVQVVLGLCCSQVSETRLFDCAGCSRALLFTSVRD